MIADVRDARPPLALIRLLNPIMRLVLPTPLGRLVRPFALLEFTGRRSGRRYRVPVGWHRSGNAPVVLTPAPWRANFDGGRPVRLYHLGRRRDMVGTLVADPDAVASELRAMFADGASPRRMGLDVPAGHTISGADVVAVDRALIRFADGGSDG